MKYDRRILVPYLENVYSLEMLDLIMSHKVSALNDEINNEQQIVNNYNPDEIIECATVKKNSSIADYFTGLFGGGLTAIVIVFFAYIIIGFILGVANLFGPWIVDGEGLFISVLAFIFDLKFLIIFTWPWHYNIVKYVIPACIVFAVVSAFLAVSVGKDTYKSDLKKNYDDHQLKLSEQENRKNASQASIVKLDQLNQAFNKMKKEVKKIRKLKQNTYSVNIIPIDYRDASTITYLYRYFSSSNADDLDMIIQTLLLDNIMSKLDEIQDQLNEIVINQKEMKSTLNEIHASSLRNEKKNESIKKLAIEQANSAYQSQQYLEMIEVNTKASAYLQAATYLSLAR